MMKICTPISLEDDHVKLILLEPGHRDDLVAVAKDGRLWELWYTYVPSEDTIDAYIQQALDQYASGSSLPFVVIDKSTSRIVGCTRYCHIDQVHTRLEIGYTWYAASAQKTAVNTATKFLLLRHAFETLDVIAVEFRTHWHNHPSRAAILRLGAKQDGVLRNHRIDADGALRDTVVYSILPTEWPTVKKSLIYRLHQKK